MGLAFFPCSMRIWTHWDDLVGQGSRKGGTRSLPLGRRDSRDGQWGGWGEVLQKLSMCHP